MTVKTDAPRTRRLRRPVAVAAVACLVTLAGLAGVYGIAGAGGNDAACPATLETAKRMAPFARGEVAAVAVATESRAVPALTFRDANGQARNLSEWRGRTVLLNLWATWCVPCRKEMPALAELQAKLGGNDFEVVTVNIDTRNLDKPKDWLREVGISGLTYYADPSAKVFQELKAVGRAFGMPTTLIVDPSGCELGYLAGPAEWSSEDALKLIGAALKPST